MKNLHKQYTDTGVFPVICTQTSVQKMKKIIIMETNVKNRW